MKLTQPLRFILLTLLISLSQITKADDSMMFSELEFPDMDGKTVHMQDFKGKVVLLNFWATWCPPCIKEMPSMQRLRNKFADQPFEIVAINTGDTPKALQTFLDNSETELTFPILLDQRSISFAVLQIPGLPMSFLLNKDGKSVMTFMGGREWDEEAQVKEIKKALSEG